MSFKFSLLRPSIAEPIIPIPYDFTGRYIWNSALHKAKAQSGKVTEEKQRGGFRSWSNPTIY
jgi:hypothetical protein